MPVVTREKSTVHTMHGARFTAYANASTGAEQLRLWQVEVPADTIGAEHRIHGEEVFAVIAGTMRLTVDGESAELRPGDVGIAPAGTVIRADNTGAETLSVWVAAAAGFTAQLADGTVVTPPWAA
jgi:quercetin dioxygenase-like cupin family protein